MVFWGIAWGAVFGYMWPAISWSDDFRVALGAVLGGLAGWTLARRGAQRVGTPAGDGTGPPRWPRRGPRLTATAPPTAPPSAAGDGAGACGPPLRRRSSRTPRPAFRARRGTPCRAAASPTSSPPPAARARDWLLGGNTVVRIGVVLLFIGLAFLAKYAVEHALVPPELRLAAIGAAGIALFVFGLRMRGREGRQGYALTLQGAGIAVLYLTVFAAFRLYQFLPAGAAFARSDSSACSRRDRAGAERAGRWPSSALPAASRRRCWYPPGRATTSACSAITCCWAWPSPVLAWREGLAPAQPAGLLRHLRHRHAVGRAEVPAGAVRYHRALPDRLLRDLPGGQPALRAAPRPARAQGGRCHAGLRHAHRGLRPAGGAGARHSLCAGLLVAGAGRGLPRAWAGGRCAAARGHARGEPLAGRVLRRAGLGFLTLAVPLALDGRWTSAVWAVEGAGVYWMGRRQGRWLARRFGLALQGLRRAAVPGSHGRQRPPPWPFANPAFIGATMLAGAALAIAWWSRDPLPQEGRARRARVRPGRGPLVAGAVLDRLPLVDDRPGHRDRARYRSIRRACCCRCSAARSGRCCTWLAWVLSAFALHRLALPQRSRPWTDRRHARLAQCCR